MAQDVWAGSLSTIQKCKTDQVDMLGLLEYLMARLSLEELEFFCVGLVYLASTECCCAWWEDPRPSHFEQPGPRVSNRFQKLSALVRT